MIVRTNFLQVRSLFFSYEHKGEVLVSGAFDGTIVFSDGETGEILQRLEGHTDRVVQAVPHKRFPWLLSCSVDKTLRLWM